MLAVAVACFGMLPVFLFGPAANADPLGARAATLQLAPGPTGADAAAADAQLLTAASTAAATDASRDDYTVNKPTEATVAPGSSTNRDWATLVLVDGGWPTSENNITVILQWMDSENDPASWWLRNNPLNNGYGSGGGSGFGSYPELVTAARDAAINLSQNSVYSAIIADFAASAPVAETVSAIEASPWASSHYGYGNIWHGVDVPIVAADADAW
ncbi:hypothetical protein [Subtercola sp. YIM 133946]|uniref:hypothetical protein n=1 Tax=Subtercola sp. YIM 133946 TaxID=3118909 RepID=UPI002F93A9D2